MYRLYQWVWPLGLSFVALGALPSSKSVVHASRSDLVQVVGGACQDCQVDNTGPCVINTCVKQKDGTYLKTVGTMVSPMKCINVGAGEPGTTTCSSTIPKDCKNESTCTDAACTNCGAQTGKDPRDTKCTLGTYLCTGVAVAVDPVNPVNPATGD